MKFKTYFNEYKAINNWKPILIVSPNNVYKYASLKLVQSLGTLINLLIKYCTKYKINFTFYLFYIDNDVNKSLKILYDFDDYNIFFKLYFNKHTV